MGLYGNNLDVSNSVDVTSPAAVNREIGRIYTQLYPGASTEAIDRAFGDLDLLYRGAYPGYHSCDTPYHDIQHVLDVTLAMARLMDGYERMEAALETLRAAPLYRLGVVTALFHDIGYLRAVNDTEHRNGAEMTLTPRFARLAFPALLPPADRHGRHGRSRCGAHAFHRLRSADRRDPVPSTALPAARHLLGTADLIAQMADRCYLEKCRDRLYPEFVLGGIARKRLADGSEDVLFESGEDLVKKTPKYFEDTARRLDQEFGSSYQYGGRHFGGENPYVREIHRNVRFAEALGREEDASTLKRVPPSTLVAPGQASQQSPLSPT